MQPFSVETRGPATWVLLHHGKVNPLGPDMVSALTDLASQLAPGTGPVVLASAARVFSAGLDLPALAAHSPEAFLAFMTDFDAMITAWFTLPRPLLTCVSGHAIAGGCILAQTGDLRLGARGSYQVGVTEVELGVPFPAGLTRMFQAQMGERTAFHLTALASLYGPEEALSLGMFDALCDDVEKEVQARAESLARLPADAYARNKRLHRASIAAEMARLDREHLPEFAEQWFSPLAQAKRGEVLARLAGSKPK